MNEYPITNTWLNMFYVEGPGPKSKHYTKFEYIYINLKSYVPLSEQ